jgi:integrase
VEQAASLGVQRNTSLARKGRVSASTQNQAFSALLFLYREVLGREIALSDVVRAKRLPRVPLVLTRDEVAAILRHLEGSEWLMASLMYGSGLRLLECLRLRVKDIDLLRCEITVRDGKGGKDRITLLPGKLTSSIEAHLARVRRRHEVDIAAGVGSVALPDALERKYSRAPEYGLFAERRAAFLASLALAADMRPNAEGHILAAKPHQFRDSQP